MIGGQVPIYSLSDISQMEGPPKGVFVVDSSDIIKKNPFGLDLSKPLVDYTLGWFSPLGAHSDYRNREVQALLRWFGNSDKKDSP
jgi:hypothetical protein